MQSYAPGPCFLYLDVRTLLERCSMLSFILPTLTVYFFAPPSLSFSRSGVSRLSIWLLVPILALLELTCVEGRLEASLASTFEPSSCCSD